MALVTRRCDPRLVTSSGWTVVPSGTAIAAVTKSAEPSSEQPEKSPRITAASAGLIEGYRFKLHPELATLVEAGGKIVGSVLWVNMENQSATGKNLKITYATKTNEPEPVKLVQSWASVSAAEAYALENWTSIAAFEEGAKAAEVVLEHKTAKELWIMQVSALTTVETAAAASGNPVSMLV